MCSIRPFHYWRAVPDRGVRLGLSEVLQNSHCIQADESSERLGDRGSCPGSIHVLYGVEMDGQREHVGVPEPGSRAH